VRHTLFTPITRGLPSWRGSLQEREQEFVGQGGQGVREAGMLLMQEEDAAALGEEEPGHQNDAAQPQGKKSQGTRMVQLSPRG